jgi:hypothetical protein
VYLRAGTHRLPDLVVRLRGQFDIELVGRVDTAKNGGLRTSFETVPDVPVSTFVLDLQGGKKGLLQNSSPLCRARGKATIQMTGQNGAVSRKRRKLQTSCGGSASRRHKRHLRRHRLARTVR